MAVWLRSSKDNHHIVLLSVAVLLSGFSTMAAPTESQWWTNPCGTHTIQLRHGRSPAENQLRIFIKMIDNPVSKDLRAIYPHVSQKQLRRNCPRINSVIKLMKNSANFTQATHIFYETMVEMAKFLHKIKVIRVKQNAKFNLARRTRMYEEVEANLKSVMCEFNDTLTKFESPESIAVPMRVIIHRSISSKCIPKGTSLSKAQFLDIDIFQKLKKFFRQSRKILRQKKRSTNTTNGQTKKRTKKNSRKRIVKHQKTKQ